MAAGVPPRLEVVAHHDGVEPRPLGVHGEFEEIAGSELLRGGLVPELQHRVAPCLMVDLVADRTAGRTAIRFGRPFMDRIDSWRGLEVRRRFVGEDHRASVCDAAGGNRIVACPQPREHLRLRGAGDHPHALRGSIDRRTGQGHPQPALVGSGRRDVPVGAFEHRISGHQRGRMAVLAEPEVHQIETALAGVSGDDLRVFVASPVGVLVRHRHRVEVHVRESGRSQDCRQSCGVAVRVSVGRHALVDLEHVNAVPREIQLDQAFEHLPRRAPAAQRDAEAAMPGHRGPCPRGDVGRRREGHVGIGAACPDFQHRGRPGSMGNELRRAAMITAARPRAWSSSGIGRLGSDSVLPKSQQIRSGRPDPDSTG